MKKIAFASDHGGYALKHFLISNIDKTKYEAVDCGCNDSATSVDYPDFAKAGCAEVTASQCEFCVLVCGTGIGISITANKIKGIRCSLCSTEYDAEMTRKHNNANVIALGGRTIGENLALNILNKFLESQFEGGRHQSRIDKITQIENNQ